MTSWDPYFFKMCDVVASKSKDPSTKVGAVIVDADRRIRSTGYNGFPQRIADDIKSYAAKFGVSEELAVAGVKLRYVREEKLWRTVHAERNAVYSAAKMGTSTDKCHIYINSLPPCTGCAQAIIQSGIVHVSYIDDPIPDRWTSECVPALAMLHEAGVIVNPITRQALEDYEKNQ